MKSLQFASRQIKIINHNGDPVAIGGVNFGMEQGGGERGKKLRQQFTEKAKEEKEKKQPTSEKNYFHKLFFFESFPLPFPGPCISSRIITFSASFLCVVVLNVSFMCVSAFFSLPFIHLFIDQPTALRRLIRKTSADEIQLCGCNWERWSTRLEWWEINSSCNRRERNAF